jgi:hypothetical protein
MKKPEITTPETFYMHGRSHRYVIQFALVGVYVDQSNLDLPNYCWTYWKSYKTEEGMRQALEHLIPQYDYVVGGSKYAFRMIDTKRGPNNTLNQQ